MKFIRYFRMIVLPAALLGAWWAASTTGAINPYLLPSPTAVAITAWEMAASGELGIHVGASLGRVALGFGLAIVAAVPIALAQALWPWLDDALKPLLDAARVVPPLALVPLLIVWLGIGEGSKLAIVVLSSFFPIHLNTLSAVRDIDRSMTELADTLDLTTGERVLHILLPAAAPTIAAGLRLGFGYAWRALVGAELIAAASGLGYLIMDAGEMARTDRVFVGIAVIAVLGVATDALFARLAGSLLPWSRAENGRTP